MSVSLYQLYLKSDLKNNFNQLSLPTCKHIAKAPRANAITKALSKSLQSQRTERNCFKKFADT
jgi:hypothetical protein